jgi:hypothetical protein
MHKVNPHTFIAITLLGIMFLLMNLSVRNDSAIMDELAHIPAGYSYVALKDMRLNPEHPPLIKDLAGIPLLFLDLTFPTAVKPWAEDLNGQWEMGRIFLYRAGNNPDQILRWARFPMMVLAVLFGWLLYCWTNRRFGAYTALLTLFLFAFSPTFIAHARYVTTDLAASFGFLIGIMTFIDFLEERTPKRLLFAGLALGIALLLKFSTILLLPVYTLITVLWIIFWHKKHLPKTATLKKRIIHIARYTAVLFGQYALIGIIAAVVIIIVYQWHILNYPAERQLADASEILNTFGKRWLVNTDLWLIQHNATRALGQYMLGMLMVVQRAAGGNTTYFLGEVGNEGWWYYFPLLYLLKETITLHILTLLALGSAAVRMARKRKKPVFQAFGNWFRAHTAEASMLIFIAVYWWYSIKSPLNIGIRHVMPTFPFIYILVSKEIAKWLTAIEKPNPKNLAETFRQLYRLHIGNLWKYSTIAFVVFGTTFSALTAYPYYVSYFNALAGGPAEAYRIATDSNFDWGQDLLRLRDYVEENRIEHIAIDYFGAGDIPYYFGSNAERWWSSRGKPRGYFAISASFRQGALGAWLETPYHIKPPDEDRYPWLYNEIPVARAGTSIFIYTFE